MDQIAQIVLMPAPVAIPEVPPGLEYLTLIDHILVDQQIEICEGKCNYTLHQYTFTQDFRLPVPAIY